MNAHREFIDLAQYYHRLGLNVTCVSDYVNDHTKSFRSILKNPNHPWRHLFHERQELKELMAYEWGKALGIGCIGGFCCPPDYYTVPLGAKLPGGSDGIPSNRFPGEAVRAIDVDGNTSQELLISLLNLMELPRNYEWVTYSGSGKGFHIIVRSTKPDLDMLDWEGTAVSSYKPRKQSSVDFDKLEFLWNTNIMLPPSAHPSGSKYRFASGKLPLESPAMVNVHAYDEIIERFLDPSSVEHGASYNSDMGFDLPLK